MNNQLSTTPPTEAEVMVYRAARERYMRASTPDEQEVALTDLINADVWCGCCDRE